MREILIEREDINVEALDDALRTALDTAYIGLSTRPNVIVLHLAGTTTPAQRNQARQLVINHDSSQRTQAQQKRQQRRQRLAQLRQANRDDINTDDYTLELPLLRALAQKIAWLEQEIRELRNQ